jgi:uncharacterized membrane protein YcaP (DUF421 family)
LLIALARTIVLYLLIIVGIRLMGKRQIGELEPSELVLAMLISDLAAVPMQDFGIPLLFGAAPIITLLCVTMLLSMLTMKSVRFRRLMCGQPSIVIDHGVIVQREMRKNRLTVDELLEELRLQGIMDPATVKYAILETNGRLSTLLYANQQPATPEQLGLTPEDASLPLLLVNDGRVLEENLRVRGLNQGWLDKQLAAHQVSSVQDVYLLTIDQGGRTYFAPKEVSGR